MSLLSDGTRPLVGLTTYREEAAWGVWRQRADLLHAEYADAIVAAGGVPVLLPPASGSDISARSVVARLDALVVSGGADVDPGRYGEEPHDRTSNWREDRDAWEIALLTAAAEVGLPVLGVCRGMQLMAVAAGGSLDQHTPDVVGHDEHSPGGDAFGRLSVRTLHGSRVAAAEGETVGATVPPPPVGARAPGLRRHRVVAGRDRRGDGGTGRPVLRRGAVAPGDGPRPGPLLGAGGRGCRSPVRLVSAGARLARGAHASCSFLAACCSAREQTGRGPVTPVMTSLVDETIAELRANHDRLRAVVEGLTDDQLAAQSGAEKWTVADVLSHLGSGAEIARYSLLTALGDDGSASGDRPTNQDVWDRWNALPPTEQASGFLESDGRLVELYESLTPEQRETTMVDLGFLPAPVPLTTPLAMRLNEQTLHGWDARVGLDPTAVLSDEAADLVVRHYTGSMAFMLGFTGKADKLDEDVRLTVGDHTLVVDDSVALVEGVDAPTATFTGPREAVVRLLAGRLKPENTPAGIEVTGNVTLEELRRVFPGY